MGNWGAKKGTCWWRSLSKVVVEKFCHQCPRPELFPFHLSASDTGNSRWKPTCIRVDSCVPGVSWVHSPDAEQQKSITRNSFSLLISYGFLVEKAEPHLRITDEDLHPLVPELGRMAGLRDQTPSQSSALWNTCKTHATGKAQSHLPSLW